MTLGIFIHPDAEMKEFGLNVGVCTFLLPCLKSSVHLRASVGRGSPEHHAVAEIRRDGDEEPAGQSRPQHLGPSHNHPAPSQPVLVILTLHFL